MAPPGYSTLLHDCLLDYPMSRPTFEAILSSELFSSLVAGVFQCMEVITTKDARDIFNFLKGMTKIMSVFSERLIRKRFLPIFLLLLERSVQFGMVIIPAILAAESKFDDDEFLAEVIRPLKNVLRHVEHPKVLEAYLDRTDVIVRRIPQSKRGDFVYPVLFAAIDSTAASLNEQCLISLPYFIPMLDEETARSMIRSISKLLERTPLEAVAVRAIEAINLFILKIGSQAVVDAAVPSVLSVWRRQHWPRLIAPVITLLCNVNVPVDVGMSRVVILAAEMLSHPELPPVAQGLLISLIGRTIIQLQTDHQLPPELMEQAREYEIAAPAYPASAFVPRSQEADLVIEVADETPPHSGSGEPAADPGPVPVAAADEDDEGEDGDASGFAPSGRSSAPEIDCD
jgi:hypothetical protein